ncbi:GTPase-activating Rap/Ran-GAP domain-like protein 3 [Ataeniobius toweri]|uniref:GTPase-activating Rap/Ran-GAP domain-like protein 3 n=1 Tax=Ataeniobius toweri TaxID=208326 RepID=A0ABU7CDP4_9TELE|nr:GTPase-activating Rap/Ran-GAP domain-like protein 3 [Ataeniobius toweri]
MNSVDPASNKLLTFNQRSASEDLGCRRGDFSRKHYGSVELLAILKALSRTVPSLLDTLTSQKHRCYG